MESARVCVIDSSATIRETIAIVLGGEHEVKGFAPDEFRRHPSPTLEADLIVADDALPADAIQLLPRDRPVLWLWRHSGTTATPGDRRPGIPRWFSPEDLRAMVQSLLAEPAGALPPFDSWSGLEYPMLAADVVPLARRAATTRFPVLICGEVGTGKARLARAIHNGGGQGRFVHVADSTCTRLAIEQAGGVSPGTLTLFVHDVSSLPLDGQRLLLELLDCGGFFSAAGWHAVRLICGTSQSFSDLARVKALDRDVFYRLSVLPLSLLSLRERSQDIPALANCIAADIARTLGTQPVTFSARAMERLTHYLWFGNLAELETVLTRTVALTSGRRIEADDLLFGYGRIAPRRAEASPATAPHKSEPLVSVGGTRVDLIINELAHEFKNPMVTIKTIAQHMERMLADQESRQDIARLTGEAVDRMDRVLENLLQFTRFRTPAPHDIALAALLAPSLLNITPALSERRVALDYRPPTSHSAFVDAEQIEYALDNLLHAIVRDLHDGQTLSIHSLDRTSGLTFEYPSSEHTLAGTLSDMLDDTGTDGGEALPLGLVLAKTLIERNGGYIETRSSAAITSVIVSLPSRGELATGNGKTTSPSS